METKPVCKVEGSSLDIISTLPEVILETILCLLPTKEAARTSILSREWRYKWTKLSKLEFDLPLEYKEKQVQGENMDRECGPFNGLHQILLSHKGPIHELTLDIDPFRTDHDPSGFDQIILYLSKNHAIKKFTLYGGEVFIRYGLPVSVFLLHHLTDLHLSCVYLDDEPILNGFSSLRSLVLVHVAISTKTLLQLLSNCPSLKSLTLLTNPNVEGCTIIELIKCLPVIEHLTAGTFVFRLLVLDSVPKRLPTSLFHLKYFSFEDVCFDDGYGLAFLLVLFRCSPNLEKIKLEIDYHHECSRDYPVVWGEYSDVWLEHLIELEIDYFGNSKPEMDFVKFILARSPKLKKVSLTRSRVSKEERLEMLQVLLQAPHASPVVICV